MADFNINHITNKNGEQGPTIAGITTVNSTGAVKIPSGGTLHGRILKEDPYYEFGAVLSPFNEKKYSTAFTDRSKYNDGWTTVNNTNANDNGKFYPTGAYFDGTDDRLYIPYTIAGDAYELGSRFSSGKYGSWTWETWFYHDGSANYSQYLLVDNTCDQVSNGFYGKHIGLTGEDGTVFLNFQRDAGYELTHIFNGNGDAGAYKPRVNYTSDTWQHAAISFDGPAGVWRLFINGTIAGTVAYSNEDNILEKNGVDPRDIDKFNIGIDAGLGKIAPRRDFRSGRIHVGANHGSAGDFKGYLQDYRFYNGVCKYKESFTVPTQMAFGELR
tara:strand:- start:1037 stop:2020 length:984 start_codon:yes stop_codon:yes gene_type:complete